MTTSTQQLNFQMYPNSGVSYAAMAARAVLKAQLRKGCIGLQHRQRLIGVTSHGRCVRCICIRLKCYTALTDPSTVNEPCKVVYENHIFSLERLEPDEEVWGVK